EARHKQEHPREREGGPLRGRYANRSAARARAAAAVMLRAVTVGLVVASALSPPARQPSFKTETRLIVLRATVQNSRGAEVADLEQSAFAVYENGKRQPIMLFRRDDIPVSIAILIDNSGSMKSLRARVERAALAFVQASNPLDEVSVINFADKPHLDVTLTSSLDTLRGGVGRVDSIGGTALRDAIAMGESYLHERGTRDRRVLLAITDGRDNASQATEKEIAALSRQTDTAIYGMGLFALA